MISSDGDRSFLHSLGALAMEVAEESLMAEAGENLTVTVVV